MRVQASNVITMIFQGREQSQPRFEGERSQRRKTKTRVRSCSIKEEVAQTTTSTLNVAQAFTDKVVGGQSNDRKELFEENQDSVAKKSLVSETFSESHGSSNEDRPRQNQNQPIVWVEPKRGRKIQTTSLLLRRKKKIKRRNKQKHVLRLRGGNGDEENGDGMNFSDEEDKDGAINSKQDKTNKDEPSITNGEKVSSRMEDDKEATKKAEIEDEEMTEADIYKDADLEPPPKKRSCDPPLLQSYFESSKKCQRPAPLYQPRVPDMECGNTTADVIENEDGCEIFSPWKEKYQRTNGQMEAVIQSKADQRKSGGGVYQSREQDDQFLSIQKGHSSKNIGLKLETFDAGKVITKWRCFALMNYESFDFSKSDPEVRIRKEQPKSTSTGYIWHGYGTDFLLPTSSVQCKFYAYCERSGERDIHFSEMDCGRITEAPGASQHLCCSQSCGVVFWHFSQKQFICKSGQWKEELQNDFALVKFRTGNEELIWTQWSPDREPTRTRWVRLGNSPAFDGVYVDSGTKQRIENFLKGNHLPEFSFPQPNYGPVIQHWRDQETLRRQPATSDR